MRVLSNCVEVQGTRVKFFQFFKLFVWSYLLLLFKVLQKITFYFAILLWPSQPTLFFFLLNRDNYEIKIWSLSFILIIYLSINDEQPEKKKKKKIWWNVREIWVIWPDTTDREDILISHNNNARGLFLASTRR